MPIDTDLNVNGSRRAWQRICSACYVALRVKALWAKVRQAYSSCIARVLARGLIRALERAADRVYKPGAIGFVRARGRIP